MKPQIERANMTQTRIRGFALLILICCTLALLIFSPTKAWAIVEGDQSSLSDEEINEAIASGRIPDTSSNISTLSLSTNEIQGDKIKSFAGINRFETASLQATYGWSSSRYAIIAGENGWPDALAATSLAGALDCPILLTSTAALSPQTSEALTSLGVSEVIILGSTHTVSAATESSIKTLGISTTRLGGTDRFDTQLKIYQYGLDKSLWSSDLVIVASGENFADALSAAPIAAKKKCPIFLTNNDGGFTGNQEATLVKDASGSPKMFKSALILGDQSRVSSITEGFLWSISKMSSGSSKASTRLAGGTRYETSALIASWGIDNAGLSKNNVAFATGESPYDALGGGVLQAKEGSILLLVSDTSTSQALGVLPKNGSITTIKVFGAKPAVSMAVRLTIADSLGFAYSEIKGLKVYIDAGHGWDSSNNGLLDYGASGNGYREYDLNAELANKVANSLQSTYGIDCYVNDNGGWYKLRHAEAIALGCDLFVSIHFNATGSGVSSGTESYIHSYNAAAGSSTLQKKVHTPLVQSLGLNNRGMKSAELAVVGGKLPAVLLEIAFIDNANDMTTYQSKKDSVATAIARGIAS